MIFGLISLSILFIADIFHNRREVKRVAERQNLEFIASQDKDTVEIILTGDVMLGRTVMAKSLEENNPSYPFQKVAKVLEKADVVFINLENPIVKNCPPHKSGFKFCASPEMLTGLRFAGVDIANLANNHTANYGQEGLQETLEALEDFGILTTGLGSLATKTVRGVKFGFLGFDFSSLSADKADYELVNVSKPKVDVLIVGVHFAGEYFENPGEIQKTIAQKLIENGASVVAGHGPHWVQRKEEINGYPVYYSLGNFVFDQMWSEKTRQGLAVRLIFKGHKLVSEEELPVYIKNWAQPEFVEE